MNTIEDKIDKYLNAGEKIKSEPKSKPKKRKRGQAWWNFFNQETYTASKISPFLTDRTSRYI